MPDEEAMERLLESARHFQEVQKYAESFAVYRKYWVSSRDFPSQAGVRLSFVLTRWRELGDVYPPALQELERLAGDQKRKLSLPDPAPLDTIECIALLIALGKDKELTAILEIARPLILKVNEKLLKSIGVYFITDRNYELADRLGLDLVELVEHHRSTLEGAVRTASVHLAPTRIVAIKADIEKEIEKELSEVREYLETRNNG